ncbi:MAG: M28 family peptidase [Bacteroidota bacterium]|nr:M28 family peptidase [Bacteroidota bacterium]
MKASSIGVLFYLFSISLAAQVDSSALRYAAGITEAELREHLQIIASDEYEGRDTGKEGQKKAAAYLKAQFVAAGIPPIETNDPAQVVEGYFQPFSLIGSRSGSISIDANGKQFGFMKEVVYFNEMITADMKVEQILFLGDGRNLSGIQKDDAVMLVDDGTTSMVEFMGWLQSNADQVRSAGASLLLVFTPRIAELVNELGHFMTGSKMRLADLEKKPAVSGMQTLLIDQGSTPDLLVSRKRARMDKLKRGRTLPANFTLVHTPMQEEVVSENVLAYIEGTEMPDELLIITAHYDHIGVENGEVYNGADDDGSGTVALIEIAEAFAQAKAEGKGPRRSVLVMPVSGEEKGLLGSRYYSEHPVFPLENSVANLNIDMIGRTDSAHAGGDTYVYVIGSDRLSSELHEINEKANSTYGNIALDYTFNSEDDPNKFYYRSDHYNFARKGVPAIFYFSGVHEDYHKPTDTVEKIQFDRLHQRALLVFHTAWILANQDKRIAVDKPIK